MNIFGKRVMLRAVEESDLKMIQEMFNDPEMEYCVVGWAFPLSFTAQKKWYEQNYNTKDFRFVIETKEEGAVGIATLTNIDWKNRSATHGIKLVSSKVRSKGYGTDSVMALMRYAFDELQLNRIETTWYPNNLPSKNMYMKLGWKVEGCKRQYTYKRGCYHDVEISSILKEDYNQLVSKDQYWDNK